MSRFSRIVNVEDLRIAGLNDVAGKSIAAYFVAKTFIYTGDETGQQTAGGAAGPPGAAAAAAPGAKPAAAPAPPPAARPAPAARAQTLKERAEGRGAE